MRGMVGRHKRLTRRGWHRGRIIKVAVIVEEVSGRDHRTSRPCLRRSRKVTHLITPALVAEAAQNRPIRLADDRMPPQKA